MAHGQQPAASATFPHPDESICQTETNAASTLQANALERNRTCLAEACPLSRISRPAWALEHPSCRLQGLQPACNILSAVRVIFTKFTGGPISRRLGAADHYPGPAHHRPTKPAQVLGSLAAWYEPSRLILHILILTCGNELPLINNRIHTYMHALINNRIHTYIHACIRYLHSCLPACMHACKHAYTHAHIDTYADVFVCVCGSVLLCRHTHREDKQTDRQSCKHACSNKQQAYAHTWLHASRISGYH